MTTSPVLNFAGSYGTTHRNGVLSEHVGLAAHDGCKVVVSGTSKRQYLQANNGRGAALPILCSELVHIPTEDGPIVGRCGDYVHGENFACDGHEAEREGYRNMSEVERYWLEKREDEAG